MVRFLTWFPAITFALALVVSAEIAAVTPGEGAADNVAFVNVCLLMTAVVVGGFVELIRSEPQ